VQSPDLYRAIPASNTYPHCLIFYEKPTLWKKQHLFAFFQRPPLIRWVKR